MILSQLVEILFVSFAVSSFLVIWLNTNAFYEYSKYFNLFGYLTIGYEKRLKKSHTNVTFINYLLIDHNSFFVRLICCSVCLSVLLNVIINLLFFSLQNIFFSFILSLIIYYHLTLQKNKLENES